MMATLTRICAGETAAQQSALPPADLNPNRLSESAYDNVVHRSREATFMMRS